MIILPLLPLMEIPTGFLIYSVKSISSCYRFRSISELIIFNYNNRSNRRSV